MKQTLGILAHVDAGKTTLSERILYHTNTIRTPGRVDDGSSHMDHSEIERERGITVFSDAAGAPDQILSSVRHRHLRIRNDRSDPVR